ncbi:MAG: hypothetical protein WCB53_01250 [Terriglobales bacterium]
MAEIDTFATQLLDEARAFLEKGRTSETPKASEAYLHAALNLAFCALEAHINAIAEDFLTLSQLSPQERSILSEKKVELEQGEFRLTKRTQIYRLEDRLLFICHRFSKKAPLDRKAAYWSQFKDAMELRNGLTHPKGPAVVTEASVERALLAILQLLDVTYMRVYGKKYPGRKRGLLSPMEL